MPNQPEKIFSILQTTYPQAKCALLHDSAWQLLVATMLSAQSTDKTVNLLTPKLFTDYPAVSDFLELTPAQLKPYIFSAGFYNSRAKNILAAAKIIAEKFSGNVPNNMADLITLPGVARKTANVVLDVWFKKNQGIAVDTHVLRLSKRLGLSNQTTPEKVERDLMRQYHQQNWGKISHLLIAHGRFVCFARKPNCAGCPLNQICPSAFKFEVKAAAGSRKRRARIK